MKHIYTLFLLLTILSCGKSEKNTEVATNQIIDDNMITVTKAQFESEKMELGELTEQSFNKTVKANGFIDVPPQNKASVSAFLGGYVKKTPLLVGDNVKKGQLIVTLENTEFIDIQQNYLEITEQLTYLKTEFERQEILYNEKITSQKMFLKAESNYKTSQAQYNGLRKKLQMMNINPKNVEQGIISSTATIYAPIEGFVTKVNVSNGSYVSPSDVIIEIVNTDHIHLELSVFEKDIFEVKKEQLINFKTPEASTKTFKGKVHLIGTSIDETNRSIKIHGHIENEKAINFVTGMFVEAEIISDSKKGKTLPKDAIIETDANFFALVLNGKKEDNYTFEKIKLAIGEQNEEFVEVLNTKDFENKEILTKGVFMLLIED